MILDTSDWTQNSPLKENPLFFKIRDSVAYQIIHYKCMQCSFLDYSWIAKTTYAKLDVPPKDHCKILYHFIEKLLMENTRPCSISEFVSAASIQYGFYLFILI